MKRSFDLLLAVPALLLLSPVMALVALLVKLDSQGPALYRGKRVGRFGRTFWLIKFRTMVTGADRAGPLVTGSGDPRITRVGRILRRTKLDELPGLWNVVKGEMSLVGPRPENERSAALYTARQRELLSLLPGITSLATVKYRHEEELLPCGPELDATYYGILQDKLNLELEYLKSRTLLLDVRILCQTALALFRISDPKSTL
jgi:lipopolysaccharide/colanic/teichoic acid biosynthesis glycosyltransferase